MLAMDVWCFSKSTIRVDLEKHQTRLHYWGNSLCNFEESPLQLWGILLYNKHVVRSLEKTDGAAEKFAETGYEYCGEFGIAGRRYLRKGGDERTHQIHIFQADDWGNIGRHLAFRDYMRTHEKERNQYAKMKKALAQKFPWDIDGYCDGKENFVREMEALALSEYDGSWDRLYISAGNVQCERTISPTIEAGSVSAALLTEKGNIYVGVCIDTACCLSRWKCGHALRILPGIDDANG